MKNLDLNTGQCLMATTKKGDWARQFYKLLRFIGRQDWLRLGLRYRLLNLFVKIKRVAPYDFEVKLNGLKYRGNIESHTDWYVFFLGGYEKQELKLMENLAKMIKNAIFIDIGANIGLHSMIMSRFCSTVHSFEPYDKACKIFEEKIKLNKINNIFIHKYGLSDRNDKLIFYQPNNRNMGKGSFVPALGVANQHYETLRVVKGDDYLRDKEITKVDIIKIDVEGFEEKVLLGLRSTLERFRPFIVMELSGYTKKLYPFKEEFLKLFPNDYKLLRIYKDKKCLFIFNRAKYRLEEFNNFSQMNEEFNILLYPSERKELIKKL